MSQGYLLYSNVSALSGQVPSSCWSCIQNLECARTSSSETCHRRPHPQCGIDFSIQNTAVNGVTDSQPLWRIWLRWIHGLAQVFHLKTVFGLFFNAWMWLSYLQYCLPWTSQQLQHLQIPTAMVPNCNHSSAIKMVFISKARNHDCPRCTSFFFLAPLKQCQTICAFLLGVANSNSSQSHLKVAPPTV